MLLMIYFIERIYREYGKSNWKTTRFHFHFEGFPVKMEPAQTFGILHESSSELNTLLQFFALWADSLSDLTTGRILGNSFENYLKKHSLNGQTFRYVKFWFSPKCWVQ
ncbi:unnamed protein product [Rhizophagus irregularis]|nr:unnamed protein product [Rhizophagus irregularis]